MSQDSARRDLVLYSACVIIGSGACEGAMIAKGGLITDHILLALLNMWVPGLAAIFLRLVRREGFRDVSFSLRGSHGRRMLALGWLAPLGVGFIAYGAAWGLRLELFAAPSESRVGLEHVAPVLRLAISVALNLTIGTFLSAISAAGEEIGWRGFMLTRLVEGKIPRPVLLSGLIWSAWHLPLIVSGMYAAGPNPVLSALLFTFGTTAGGVIAARTRLESGSVWPAIAFHSSWNALIQGSFDRFTVGGDTSRTTTVWTGESGYLVIGTTIVLAAILLLRKWPARAWPDAEPMAELDASNA